MCSLLGRAELHILHLLNNMTACEVCDNVAWAKCSGHPKLLLQLYFWSFLNNWDLILSNLSWTLWIADYYYFLIRTEKVFTFRPCTCYFSSYFLISSCGNPLDCLIGCCQGVHGIIALPVTVLCYKAEFIRVSNFFLTKFVPKDFSLNLTLVLESVRRTEAVDRTRCSAMELLCSPLHDKAQKSYIVSQNSGVWS